MADAKAETRQRIRNFHLARVAKAQTDLDYLNASAAYLRAVLKRLPAKQRKTGGDLIHLANSLLKEVR